MRSIRFINAELHGILDYISAFSFIVIPLLLKFQETSPLALYLSIGAGIFLISYSLLTNYSLGVIKLIPFPIHVFVLDILVAIGFLIAPVVFGFEGMIRWYYFALGAIVPFLVLVTDPRIARVEVFEVEDG